MPHVRHATVHDLPGAYRVCLLTGDAGKDATPLARDPDLLGQVYVGPYIVGEPGLALVVADEAGIAGYCLAASDTRAFESWARTEWWPILRAHHPLPETDETSFDGSLIRQFHEPPRTDEEVVDRYPSHLHIDLLERVRGAGFGRMLVEQQLDLLRGRGSAGVHLNVATDNANAIEFYRHLGFAELFGDDDALVMGMTLA
ncbi:MAG TPA: GNAT family N-acetyltransferase [Candidatus Limnocylindrales bacterium]|jgi:ribosomal protein S18 acetylase RimI-like enzyme|nr:GNAT family N-acetyltransferase [Candidatus Limnocylindrales bacterium]